MAETTLQTQAGTLLAHAGGYVSLRTIELGLRHGLFARLADAADGLSTEELARDTGLDPFYVGVWSRAAVGAEVLETDGGTYRLAPHVATLLLDQDSPAYMGALFSVLDQPEVFDTFSDALPTGRHIWWKDTSPAWIQGVSGTGRAFYNRLIPGGLERVPGLISKLESGARVLELASGAGVGLIKLASAYPGSSFVGVDGDAYSNELAEKNLAEAGIRGVELQVSPLEEIDAEAAFDVALINISMHECRDLDKVTANVHRALAPGGVFVISDFPFPEEIDAYRTTPGRVMLGIQFFEALIDDQLLPTRAFVELLERHGFRDVASFDLTPVHAITYGRR